jgi:hypothetical protein
MDILNWVVLNCGVPADNTTREPHHLLLNSSILYHQELNKYGDDSDKLPVQQLHMLVHSTLDIH